MKKLLSLVAFATASLLAQSDPKLQEAISSISAGNLKADLSFLASDALQGRYSPSPGLDVAAEFIAAQFRGAGLEEGGDQGYFQTAHMVDRRMAKAASNMNVRDGNETWTVPSSSIIIADENAAAHISNAPVLVVSKRDPDALKTLDLAGKAVVVPEMTAKNSAEEMLAARSFDRAVSQSKAAIQVVVGARRAPQFARLLREEQANSARVPRIIVTDERFRNFIEHPQGANQSRTVSVELSAPKDQKTVLKNVIGILRGSDPQLKDSAVLVTAHYDHIGTTETGAAMAEKTTGANPNDHIYNGANDDGSGTVSVVEIAKALSRLNPHPKRTVIFIAFFGEERGLIGSAYYGLHSVWPIAKTIADINLEQVGRTDSTEGPQVGTASITGYDYSEVSKFLESAGKETGVRVYKNPQASDAYFLRSDNDALAELGIPAHTLCVAFDYSDYHGLGDEWQKIDYANMAKVDRMVALALVNMADSPRAPEWNAQNPKTAAFRAARAKSRSADSGGGEL